MIVKCIEMSSHDIVHPGHSVVDQLYFKIDKLIEKETRFVVTRGRKWRKEVLGEVNLKEQTFRNKISKPYRDKTYNLTNITNTAV